MRALDICVLSYNRPQQLERALRSIRELADAWSVTVYVCDDCSPQFEAIRSIVLQVGEETNYDIHLIKNEVNLGYDRNLISALGTGKSDYVMLLSDDDYISHSNGPQDDMDFDVLIYSFKFGNGRHRLNGVWTERINPDLIYNSILFSGLLFKRSAIPRLDPHMDFLSTSIYTQVFCLLLIADRGGKIKCSSNIEIGLGNDGENYFGLNQSSDKSEIVLQDRKSALSDFHYQKKLIETLEYVQENTHQRFLKPFFRHYTMRLVGYAFKIKPAEKSELLKLVGSSGLPFSTKLSVYLTALVGRRFGYRIYTLGVKILRGSG